MELKILVHQKEKKKYDHDAIIMQTVITKQNQTEIKNKKILQFEKKKKRKRKNRKKTQR